MPAVNSAPVFVVGGMYTTLCKMWPRAGSIQSDGTVKAYGEVSVFPGENMMLLRPVSAEYPDYCRMVFLCEERILVFVLGEMEFGRTFKKMEMT